RIGAKLPFPDTCACGSFIDNGAGLSWSLTVPAGLSLTVSHFTTFSPLGLAPLSTTKTADAATAAAGASDGYTITIHNPNASPATLNSITDTLPAGFTYTASSTTGVTTTNPGISGQTLTWAGPFSVPASGDVTLHFNVTVASTAGVYLNNAGGEAGAIPVAPTGPTAAITVTGSGAGAPASLVLTPPAATNTVGTQHCVTATVTDANGHPTPGVTVDFSVSGANAPADSSAPTDSSGQASSCYTGTATGTDTISAFADTNSNGVKDTGEPSDTATKTWTAGAPATLTLAPSSDSNTVGAQHCVTATVVDSFHNPTPGISVRFAVSGSVTTSGTGTSPTDANGRATFCYTGPALPGSDVITAYADTNNNGVQDPGEPSGRATKEWILAQSTPGCKVTGGGRITAANGDKATFGGNASATGTPSGNQEYQDHGPAADLNVHSAAVLAIVCSGNTASVFGTATINGSGSFNYRIDRTDNGEPGDSDKYRIRLSTGYDSGEQTLIGGNIQLH
ncbi:MAG TPA: post-COAP-1 domain-containing protein, partial [Mycobacterium sp.]|nr:post-COAP-1 domain-containing protein [Mycobacterium sp.]